MGRKRRANLQALWLPGDRRILGGQCPPGKNTDFRRAVDARAGEKVVFTWQIRPDKQSLADAEDRMHEDGVLETSGEIPFAAERLILGCFEPICTMGRPSGT